MRPIVLSLLACALLVPDAALEAQRQRLVRGRVGSGDLNYYVRTDGSNSNTGLLNTAAGAWLTIDKAADTVPPGAVVRVQAGTYAARISPAMSGTASLPITFVADGAVTFCGADVTNKHYVRFIGFTVDTDAGGCTKSLRAFAFTGGNTSSVGWEFWHNTFRDAEYAGIGSGQFSDRTHNFVVVGNTFTAIGSTDLGTPAGAATVLRGDNNFTAYNTIATVDPDAFPVVGNHSYWLNNYHVMTITDPAHGDVFQGGSSSPGQSDNLFEANFVVGTGTANDEHGVLLQNNTLASCNTGTCGEQTENLFRRNIWHNISQFHFNIDQAIVGTVTNTRVANDTVVLSRRVSTTSPYSYQFRSAGTTAYIFNSLHYQAWGDLVTTGVQVFFTDTGASISGADYNLAYDPDGSVTFTTPWTTQANELSNIDPALTDVANDDFTIGSGSGARNAGGALTTTSGSGTGTTFNVASGGGGWFRGPSATITTYDGKLTAGDVITVGTDEVTVVSVATDAITVTPSFTWADAEPVYLGNDTTPDIGALPYKAGGYTLSATYSCNGGTCTITPNDADLVRFVICYGNGIPRTVDHLSPFTCPVTQGFEARVYPRYPSAASRWVVATP